MGNVNQYAWVKENAHLARGPILEIGSRHYGELSYDYRSILKDKGEYVGLDMSAGENVDVIADLEKSVEALPEAIRERKFQTILCLSVMEHVRDIYAFSRTVTELLAPDGVLFLSVPWVWRFHQYPSDYWRFTPEALEFLYPKLTRDPDVSCVAYQKPGKFATLRLDELSNYPDYEVDSQPESGVGRFLLRAYSGIARRISPSLNRKPFKVLYPA